MFITVSDLRDDRGSLPLALLVAIITAGLVVTLIATTLASERRVRFDRDHTLAIQGADAGVQEAVYALNTGQVLPDCDLGELEAGALDRVDYEWCARRLNAAEYQVESTGERDEGGRPVERSVLAKVVDQPRFHVAAFAFTVAEFRGGNGAASYNSGTNQWWTETGTVGTNGVLNVRGNTGRHVDKVILYNFDADPDLERCDQSGGGGGGSFPGPTWDDNVCDTHPDRLQTVAEPLEDDLDTEFIEEALAACGTLEPWRASDHLGIIAAPPGEDHLCVDSLEFDQDTVVASDVTPDEPLKVYVRGSIGVDGSTDVNCDGQCNPGSGYPTPRALQIYALGEGDVRISQHANVAAAIFAPESECRGNPSGAQADIYGSLICGSINNQGGWSFFFDEDLMEEGLGTFRVGEWREEHR